MYVCVRTNLLKTNVLKYPSPLQVLKRIYPDEAASEDPYKLNISLVKHILEVGCAAKIVQVVSIILRKDVTK